VNGLDILRMPRIMPIQNIYEMWR